MKKKIQVKGIVYLVTNLVTAKIYIGKTKTHYGNHPHGIKARMSNHITKALGAEPNGCPAFYNAIRKYGKENFVIEELLRCDLEDLDENETEQIEIHDSTNKDIGYNIALGGGGRSVVNVSEETRKKISKRGKTMGLTKIFRDGVHVGYTARRKDKGMAYQKWFTSTKNTPSQNRVLAQGWLKNFRSHGVIGKTDYNKESGLPRNICKTRENGKHVGYVVTITRNGKTTRKSFQNNTIPLSESLKNAIKFRDDCLNEVKI